MNGMFAAAASTSTAARIDASVSMADSLRGLPDRALQGSIQSRGEERGEAFLEQARVVAVLGLAAGDQRVLGAEVVVDRGKVDARLGSEHAHRGALEAVLHEQLLGDVEDPGAGFVLGLDGAQGHGGLCNSNERLNSSRAARRASSFPAFGR